MNPFSDEHFDPIRGLVDEMQALAAFALQQYASIVDGIISTNSQDVRRIEEALNGLLDFCFFEPMVQLFRRLCRHYFDFDQNATVSYVNAYREMWDSK